VTRGALFRFRVNYAQAGAVASRARSRSSPTFAKNTAKAGLSGQAFCGHCRAKHGFIAARRLIGRPFEDRRSRESANQWRRARQKAGMALRCDSRSRSISRERAQTDRGLTAGSFRLPSRFRRSKSCQLATSYETPESRLARR